MAQPLEERLAQLRATWETLENRRIGDPECRHADGTATFARVDSIGQFWRFEGCRRCGERLGKETVSARDETLAVVQDLRRVNPPCVVCGQWGTEFHHWAPKELFGRTEAEHWPTAWLCREHHVYWHKVMQGVLKPEADTG
jgi:hypothetical protein